jgi:hypothetical protein
MSGKIYDEAERPAEDDGIIGHTVVDVRKLSTAEKRKMGIEGWGHEVPMGIVMDSGVILVPMRDDEWNGQGALGAISGKLTLSIQPTH